MKSLYSALAACAIVALVATPASAFDVKELGAGNGGGSSVAFSCDEGAQDSAFYQNQGQAYGNAFDTGAGGPLSVLDFEHFGFGFPGAYAYNVLVLDEATCTVVGSVNGLLAVDAAGAPAQEIVDLCDENIVVSGSTVVAIEPLTCAIPTDCYPDVLFDQTGTINECGRSLLVADNSGCDDPTIGGFGAVDFLLRVSVDECGSTPTEVKSWSEVKDSFRN